MSVINQMLRDLDARRGGGTPPLPASVAVAGRMEAGKRWLWGGVMVLSLLVAVLLAALLRTWPHARGAEISSTPPARVTAEAMSPADAQPALAVVAASPPEAASAVVDAPTQRESVASPVLAPPLAAEPDAEDAASARISEPVVERVAPSLPPKPTPEARIEAVVPAPAPADAALVLARAALSAGDADAALAHLQSADADNAEVWALRASAAQQLGQWVDAVDAWSAALSRRSDVGAWWVGLGIALESSGRAIEARAAFEQAQAHDAGDAALASYVNQRLAALADETVE